MTLVVPFPVSFAFEEPTNHDVPFKKLCGKASILEFTTTILQSATAPHPLQRLQLVVERVLDTEYPHDDEIWSRFDNCFSPNPFLAVLWDVQFGVHWGKGEVVHYSELRECMKERLAVAEGRGLLRFVNYYDPRLRKT